MSIFEPRTIREIIKATIKEATKRREFDRIWKDMVAHRKTKWLAHRDGRSADQLEWEANITIYVQYLYKLTTPHGNAKNGTEPPCLDSQIPILGPRFLPPSYLCAQKQSSAPDIVPSVTYLKPFNVVHPFYFRDPELLRCPKCGSREILWDDWTATGHREVHGLWREETALGYQLRCTPCQKANGGKKAEGETKEPFCFATTSDEYWKGWEHWKMPQLHLLEYHKAHLEYLHAFEIRKPGSFFTKCPLQDFSAPCDPAGYADKPITSDLITDTLLQYNARTRAGESQEYMRTRTAVTISLDNTFKVVAKATIVDKKHSHIKTLKGGILSCINELNEIISWRLCETKSNAELRELLEGLVRRCRELGVDLPVMAIFDNCCQVEAEVHRVMIEIHVCLDVHHFKERYLAVILNGMRNPRRRAVGSDITDAILKTHAQDGKPATYYSRDEQADRLETVYKNYTDLGGVWSEPAAQVHRDQMAHVRKGCLSRPREDVAADGSRIEGSHKGWNSIMRAHPSGVEVFSALADDYVHRRNMRSAHRALLASFEGRDRPPPTFITFTRGTHHTRMVDHIAGLWNSLIDRQSSQDGGKFTLRPRLLPANSNKQFSLVPSLFKVSEAGLVGLEIAKQEDEDLGLDILQDLKISPDLLNIPAESKPAAPSASPTVTAIDATGSIALLSTPGGEAEVMVESLVVEATAAVVLPDAAHPCTMQPSKALGKRKAIEPAGNDEAAMKKPCTWAEKYVPAPPLATLPSTAAGSSAQPLNHGIEAYFPKSRPRASEPTGASAVSFLKTPSALPTSTSHRVPLSPPPVDTSELVDADTHSLPAAVSTPATAPAALLAPLLSPLPSPPGSGLTRSQAFLARVTGVDPRTTSFNKDDEYYLFMDMREELQWATFKMTAMQTTLAVNLYNARLRAQNDAKQLPTIIKQPRAFLEKLASMELQIRDRIATGNYIAASTKTEDFWRRHCLAMPLQKPDPEKTKGRKASKCTRCSVIRWVGGVGGEQNHKLYVCSDGVKSTKVRGAGPSEKPPPWPQPAGLFSDGNTFHPVVFLQKIHDLYAQLVLRAATANDATMTSEDSTFAQMVNDRVHVLPNGRYGFRLYAHTVLVPQLPPAYIVPGVDGQPHLRIDCLSDPPPAPSSPSS